MRVVNDKQVSAPASNGSANTSSEIFTTFAGTPLTGPFVILFKDGAWEDLSIRWVINQIPNLTAKTNSQLRVVRSLNDL